MSREAPPDLTSMLFVPASRPRMIEKARTLPAPAVIFDLEDGVGVGEKRSAREGLVAALAGGWPPTGPVPFVRVNGTTTEHFEEDLRAAAACLPYGVCLPKCESPADVEQAVVMLREFEPGVGIRLLPFIESALGILNAAAITSASDLVVAVALGSEDLAADMGLRRTVEGHELAYFRGVVATAARATGAIPIDGVFVDFNDPNGLERDAATGRALGFGGKQIIHPSQLGPVARAYAPTDAELERARRIVEAFDEAEREGRGVVVVDGRMVDRPIVLQARRLLSTAGQRAE